MTTPDQGSGTRQRSGEELLGLADEFQKRNNKTNTIGTWRANFCNVVGDALAERDDRIARYEAVLREIAKLSTYGCGCADIARRALSSGGSE